MKLIIFFTFLFTSLLVTSLDLSSQTVSYDSVNVAYGQILIYNDTVIVPAKDTIIVIPANFKYKIRVNNHLKSQAFYDSLNVMSAKNKWSKELYNTLIINQTKPDTNINLSKKANEEYLPYEGFIINKIDIYQVDIFGSNIYDTSIRTSNKNSQAINSTHINTLKKIIKKNLIVKTGDVVNANKIADNEQIIRSLSFIKDATFIIIPIDSINVNITVVTRDYYPIGLGGSYANLNNFEIQINNKNLVGSGQEIKYRMLYNTQYNPTIGNQLEYNISNVGKSLNTFYAKYRETDVYTNWHRKY